MTTPKICPAQYDENFDPVALTLTHYCGALGYRAMIGLVMVGFVACLLGTQASISRVIWAFAGNDALPYSVLLTAVALGILRLLVGCFMPKSVDHPTTEGVAKP